MSRAALQLPEALAALRGTPEVTPSSPQEFRLSSLRGRWIELSAYRETASLTLSASLLHEAQTRGDATAWITAVDSMFFPPDFHRFGLDLKALPIVKTTSGQQAARAADTLARSGAFGLIVLDLGSRWTLPNSVQTRLAGLAKKHDTTLLCLTKKKRESPSVGSLVSWRATARVRKTAFDRFTVELDVLKDKRRGPGWSHAEDYRGPVGLH